jgi:signal transduction histidine kinase
VSRSSPRPALRQTIAGLSTHDNRPLAVNLNAEQPLPDLSPAVELAAYRIANEAIANVLRHSNGPTCQVAIAVDGDLLLTVRDDGRPPADWRPGVGIRSIRERAEELSGSADAGPTSSGWQVTARLPLTNTPAT